MPSTVIEKQGDSKQKPSGTTQGDAKHVDTK
jgi:hypothetical protein